MIKEEMIPSFDMTKVHLGDVLRFEVCGNGQRPRLGLVQGISSSSLTVVFCVFGSGQMSYLKISAKDVANGLYSLAWSHDLETVFHMEKTEETGEDSEETELDFSGYWDQESLDESLLGSLDDWSDLLEEEWTFQEDILGESESL